MPGGHLSRAMRCGLFGKLPSKRDFVAIAATREFLSAWERWLQGGLSASRLRLQDAWQEAFLRAPIWRFWLGAEASGHPVLGAFMPSVDGVGRYFPLTVFACGEALPPPEFDLQETWFSAVEDLLLSALEPQASFEALSAALAALPPPQSPTFPDVEGMSRLPHSAILLRGAPERWPIAFADARRADHLRTYARDTFWWTLGGEGFPPLALVNRGMPDPYVFAGMLTGTFEDGVAM